MVNTGECAGFEKLRPVRVSASGSALNRSGLLLLRGESDGAAVKLYETASPDQAQFIKHISESETLSDIFPNVREIRGSFVIAEWVEGTSVPPETAPEKMAFVHSRLHLADTSRFGKSAFNYWNDHIEKRFRRAMSLLLKESLAEQVISSVQPVWNAGKNHLMHPDLTIANMVEDRTGLTKIIDNEHLTLGGIPWLDICISATSLSSIQRGRYVSAYRACSGLGPSEGGDAVLRAAWVAWIVSKYFAEGNLYAAQSLISRYEEQQEVLPFNVHDLRQ